MADRLGTQVGNYRLMHLLGQGGFAEVYLGEHIHLGTQAAIKLLHAPLASAGEVEKFRQEARLIATLQHPHILRVLEFGIEASQPYLVLENAPGGSLRERHPSGTPVPLATVVSYVQQIAQALQYAHDQKLIHRDIKPQNLLLGRNGEILLSDFGISVVAESTSHQQAQGFAGTVAYSAPEQLQEHPRSASDQYALGVVVYEWLTGKLPFTGAFQEVIAKHLFAAPPPLREQLPSLPAAVEQVVLTALAKDPKERFASVSAFATALEQASQTTVSALPVVAPAPNTLPTGGTGKDMQALPPGSGAFTANLAQPPASLGVSLPPTGQLPTEAHSSAAVPAATVVASKSWQQASAPTPTYESTRTLLPQPPGPAPAMAQSPRSVPSRHKQPVGRTLAVGILLLMVVGGSLVGLGLTGIGPLARLNMKAKATATRQTIPTATHQTVPTTTATPLPIGAITEFTSRPPADLEDITNGPDNNLWFTGIGVIGSITPHGQITEFPLPTSVGYVQGITTGPDGNLWFTEDGSSHTGKIGRLTPQGQYTEFAIPTPQSGASGITVGPDGKLWFTETNARKIGRIALDGTFKEFLLTSEGRGPDAIVTGPDGNLWFTTLFSGTIGRLTPDGQFTSFPIASGGSGITVGPDGNLWFVSPYEYLVRMTTRGQATKFPITTTPFGGSFITTGPDGNLWFTEEDRNKIGRATPQGQITEFSIPTMDSSPEGITAGPDGNVWFVEFHGYNIGRITTGR